MMRRGVQARLGSVTGAWSSAGFGRDEGACGAREERVDDRVRGTSVLAERPSAVIEESHGVDAKRGIECGRRVDVARKKCGPPVHGGDTNSATSPVLSL